MNIVEKSFLVIPVSCENISVAKQNAICCYCIEYLLKSNEKQNEMGIMNRAMCYTEEK